MAEGMHGYACRDRSAGGLVYATAVALAAVPVEIFLQGLGRKAHAVHVHIQQHGAGAAVGDGVPRCDEGCRLGDDEITAPHSHEMQCDVQRRRSIYGGNRESGANELGDHLFETAYICSPGRDESRFDGIEDIPTFVAREDRSMKRDVVLRCGEQLPNTLNDALIPSRHIALTYPSRGEPIQGILLTKMRQALLMSIKFVIIIAELAKNQTRTRWLRRGSRLSSSKEPSARTNELPKVRNVSNK